MNKMYLKFFFIYLLHSSNHSNGFLYNIKNNIYDYIYKKSFNNHFFKFLFNFIKKKKQLNKNFILPECLEEDGILLINIIENKNIIPVEKDIKPKEKK